MTRNELKETGKIVLEIPVTTETAQDIHNYIHERGWEIEEGYRLLLGSGLGWLRSEGYWLKTQQEDEPQSNKKQLISRLMEDESILSAIRFRMYELQTTNKNWELSTGAILTENNGFKNLLEQQKKEISELHLKVKEQQIEIERLHKQLETTVHKADPQDPPAPQPALTAQEPFTSRWLRWFHNHP